MKLFAPEYYKDFVCIADKCRHNCCVGWEIDVDDVTLQKYKNLTHGYAETIRSSIVSDPTPHFELSSDNKCPHLNESGLCNIILNAGEELLCDICREHPRFYNDTVSGKEVGIGMSCEEACRLILSSENYNVVEIGEICGETAKLSLDARVLRNDVYLILSDASMAYNEKLQYIYDKYDASPSKISDDNWREIISSLEYLDGTHESLFLKYSSRLFPAERYEKYLEKALAYFVFRHCAEVSDQEEFSIALGFCLFCERLIASVALSENATEINEISNIARIVSEEIEYSLDNTDVIMLEISLN